MKCILGIYDERGEKVRVTLNEHGDIEFDGTIQNRIFAVIFGENAVGADNRVHYVNVPISMPAPFDKEPTP